MQSDTRTLLRTGVLTLLTGILSAVLMLTVFGGVSRQGPHTNGGWLSLMVAMCCLPTGTITLLLGLAKLAGERNRR